MQNGFFRNCATVLGICFIGSWTSAFSQDVASQIRYLEGHKGAIYAVAATADGQSLLSAGVDGTIRIWDRETGLLVRTIPAHSATVLSLAVTPDGRRFASAGLHGVINVFDLPGRNPLANITNVPGLAATLAVSPNGALVATGDNARVLRMWNATNNKHLRDFPGLTAPVTAAAFIDDGQFIIAAAADGTIRGWTVSNGAVAGLVQTSPISRMTVHSSEDKKEGHLLGIAGADGTLRLVRWPPVPPQTLPGHSNQVTAVTISHDGKRVATGGMDQLVNLTNAVTGKAIRALAGQPGKVASLAFSADDTLLASGSDAGTIKFWNTANGTDLLAIAGHTGAINALAFHPKLKQVASAGADGTVRMWRIPTAPKVLAGHSQPVATVAITADGKTAASAGSDKSIRLWSLANGKQLRAITKQPQPVTKTALSHDGKQLAAGDSLGDLRLWNLTTKNGSALLGAHVGGVSGLVFDPRGSLLYSSGLDGTVKSWNLPIAALQTFPAMAAAVHAVALSPDGKLIVAAATDGSLQIINRSTGKRLKRFKASATAVTGLSISADNSLIAASDSKGTVTLWNADDGKSRGLIAGESGAIHAISFHPKRNELAIAGADGSVRLWQTPGPARVLKGHTGIVHDVTWTADGKSILSGGADKTIRLWNAETGKLVRTFSGHTAAVNSVVSTADMTRIVSSSVDKTLRIWTLTNGAQQKSIAVTAIVNRIALNADSTRLAGVGADGVVRVWDPVVGRELQRFAGHAGAVRAVTISSDGKTVVSGGDDKSVRLWPVSAASVIVADTLKVHDLEILPDGSHIVTVGEERNVKLWDKAGKLIRTFSGFGAPVANVSVSEDGTQIAAGGDPLFAYRIFIVWNRTDGKMLLNFATPAGITAIRFGLNGRIGIAGADKHLRVYSSTDGRLLQDITVPATLSDVRFVPGTPSILAAASDNKSYLFDYSLVRLLTGHKGAVTGLSYSKNGERLVTAGADGIVRLWNSSDGEVVSTLTGSAGAINRLVVAADGKRIIAGRADKNVDVWNIVEPLKAELKPSMTFAMPTPVTALAGDKTGDRIAVGGSDRIIRLWSMKTGTEVERLTGHTGAIIALAVADDGKTLFSGSADKTSRRWTPSVVDAITAHDGAVQDVQFSSNGRQLFTAGSDKTIKSWDTFGLNPLQSYAGMAGAIHAIAVSPDDKLIAAVGEEPVVRLWATGGPQSVVTYKLPTSQSTVLFGTAGSQLLVAGVDKIVRNFGIVQKDGKLQLELTHAGHGHTEPITDLAVAADRHTLFSVAADKTLKRWYAASHAPTFRSTESQRAVYGLAISPDGSLLAGGGADKTVRIWDFQAGKLMHELTGHTRAVSAVAFHPNGKEFASTSRDGTIRLYSTIDLNPIDPNAEKPAAKKEAAQPAENAGDNQPEPPDRTPKPGLLAFTHTNNSYTGSPRHEIVSQLDLDWGKKNINLARVWVGTLTLPVAGKITFRADTNPSPNNTLRVLIGGKLVIDGLDPKSAAGGRQGTLEIKEGAPRELPIRVEFGHSGPSASMRLLWSWEGKEEEVVPAAAFKHRAVYAGDLLYTFAINEEPNALTFSPAGNWLVTAGRSRTWKRWNRANRRQYGAVDAGRGHNQTIYGLTYNKSNARIATIDYSGNLFIWNASNGQMMYHQQLPVSAGFALSYTPDGTEIIVGSSDSRVLRVLVPPPVR